MIARKKILFVYPRSTVASFSDLRLISDIVNKRGGWLNAGLPTIAALTPAHFTVKIVDEDVEPIDFTQRYDLVGLSGFASHLCRAEEIAREFSRRGALVVSGGPSVSLSPERWRPFSDVLVIGEAERTWPRFLQDYLAGQHRKEYREEEIVDLSTSPIPDYSGFDRSLVKQYIGGIVQCSRGCPFDCEFCSVTTYLGRKMRYKPVEPIIRELEQLSEMGLRTVFLADDNFSADRKRSKEILRAIRDWNRKQKFPLSLSTQVSLEIAEDEEFLELAAEAGITSLSIGFESINEESLRETGKLHNLRKSMLESVRVIEEHGIMPLGNMIVGFDHDDLSIFQQQFDFFQQGGIPGVAIYILEARDGTALKERMIREGRYLEGAGLHDRGVTILTVRSLVPKKMTADQLQQGAFWLISRLHDLDNFSQRLGVFIENYENSPKRKKLSIPRPRPELDGLNMLGRLMKYILVNAPPEEKKAFAKMLDYAAHFSHPQGWSLVLAAFIGVLNVRRMMTNINPDMEGVPYPV